MAEIITASNYETSDPDEAKNELRSGIVEIPEIGSLEDYNAHVKSTGETVSLDVVRLFAAAGDQVAIAYLEHVASTEQLVELLNFYNQKCETASSLEEVEELIEELVLHIEAMPIPKQQRQANIEDVRQTLYNEAKTRLSP